MAAKCRKHNAKRCRTCPAPDPRRTSGSDNFWLYASTDAELAAMSVPSFDNGPSYGGGSSSSSYDSSSSSSYDSGSY